MSSEQSLREKINQETAIFPWSELLKQFASGNVIAVDGELDLVEIAEAMATDNTAVIQPFVIAGKIAKVTDEQALSWLEQNLMVWTVVIKPWILVQHRVEQ
ncbi:DUF2288 domain-containing protein [Undibacterium sp. RuRC25W]|uniref:DUF2288 domain-containing protein n=1 Tax=Undibacterium sp. RuRC25W TaxID=3413047 RepID=UPI003BF42632